ncbi:MAG: hypothetical protein RAO94_07230 [Candidatus Stygibacter australis]|nr:hypothetical protein [Candidatus Stygibacter australis]
MRKIERTGRKRVYVNLIKKPGDACYKIGVYADQPLLFPDQPLRRCKHHSQGFGWWELSINHC